MNVDVLTAFISGVVGGSIVSGMFNLVQERLRRRHERRLRAEERTNQLADAERERRVKTYSDAMIRLRSARSAFHRVADVLYFHEEQHLQPFSRTGTIDWAIDEADQLRTVQPGIDLFGSNEVKSSFALAVKDSESIRFGLGMPDFEWGASSARTSVESFDVHFEAALEQMRADLEA